MNKKRHHHIIGPFVGRCPWCSMSSPPVDILNELAKIRRLLEAVNLLVSDD